MKAYMIAVVLEKTEFGETTEFTNIQGHLGAYVSANDADVICENLNKVARTKEPKLSDDKYWVVTIDIHPRKT